MEHITLLALPSSLSTSISLPLEILTAANQLARSKNRHLPKLSVDIVAKTKEPLQTSGGLSINPTATPKDVSQTDLVMLPSLWRNPINVVKQHQLLLPWLQQMAKSDSVICAAGTSSYFLAEAGLLDGKPATTHWRYCDDFAKRYPKVELKREYLITQSNSIYCAGSVNSIADLMVHLIGKIYGLHIARQVEAQFSPEIRRPFEDHAYAELESTPHQDETIIEAQEWLRENFQDSVSMQQLASHLDLSLRSFNRRFKQAVGITASEYLYQQRLHNARELLRTSNLSIHEIATNTGFQDSSYFCSRFKQSMRQTPMAYRKSVRGKLFKVV